jgi:hypothetical protein
MQPDPNFCGMDAAALISRLPRGPERIICIRHFPGVAIRVDPMQGGAALDRKGMDTAIARGPR